MKGTKTNIAGGMGAGAAAAGVTAWAWNSFMPEHPMPAEVAAALGALLGHIIGFMTERLT